MLRSAAKKITASWSGYSVSHLVQVIVNIFIAVRKWLAGSHLFSIEYHAGNTPNLVTDMQKQTAE